VSQTKRKINARLVVRLHGATNCISLSSFSSDYFISKISEQRFNPQFLENISVKCMESSKSGGKVMSDPAPSLRVTRS